MTFTRSKLLLHSTYHIAQRERVFCHFSSDNFQQYTCSIHESIGRRFCNHALANVFFSNKRKLSNDSAVGGGIKVFKKKDREKSKLESIITLNFYFVF